MKLTLKDGRVIEGTPDELARIINSANLDVVLGKYGNKIYYKSESKGLVEIKNMNEIHIRNAMCKIYREWVEGLNKLEPAEFLTQLSSGLTDETFISLAVELARKTYVK